MLSLALAGCQQSSGQLAFTDTYADSAFYTKFSSKAQLQQENKRTQVYDWVGWWVGGSGRVDWAGLLEK